MGFRQAVSVCTNYQISQSNVFVVDSPVHVQSTAIIVMTREGIIAFNGIRKEIFEQQQHCVLICSESNIIVRFVALQTFFTHISRDIAQYSPHSSS